MARSITAFFKARKSDSNSLWVIGWVTSCSTSSLGIFGSKAHCVRECVFDFFFLGISTPISHDMPRTQNFGQVPTGWKELRKRLSRALRAPSDVYTPTRLHA